MSKGGRGKQPTNLHDQTSRTRGTENATFRKINMYAPSVTLPYDILCKLLKKFVKDLKLF